MDDNFIEKYPQGFWETHGKKFINKYQAILHSKNNFHSPIYYKYFNSVWENFDRSLLGTVPLKELYKQRAQQLRDKYDYLIVYFSGGADSYNALMSFIENGIRIDEVCVKWCNDTYTAHTQIYQPNVQVGTATNYLSEWDFAIKPVLEWLGQHHPEVNIEIVDWFKDKNLITSAEVFNKVNHWHDVEVTSLAVWSPSERKLIEQGKTVGSIYGIDKPCTYFADGEAYLYFPDGGTAMGTPNDINIFGTEYFYWSPDLPLLTFEMANQAIRAFNTDKELAKISITEESVKVPDFILMAWQLQQKKLRHVLYDNWTDRFQAYKPVTQDRSDKHWWIFRHPELVKFKEGYTDMLNLHLDQLGDSPYLGYRVEKSRTTPYKPIPSKKHFVCKCSNPGL